jgi:hypothetical protein
MKLFVIKSNCKQSFILPTTQNNKCTIIVLSTKKQQKQKVVHVFCQWVTTKILKEGAVGEKESGAQRLLCISYKKVICPS